MSMSKLPIDICRKRITEGVNQIKRAERGLTDNESAYIRQMLRQVKEQSVPYVVWPGLGMLYLEPDSIPPRLQSLKAVVESNLNGG